MCIHLMANIIHPVDHTVYIIRGVELRRHLFLGKALQGRLGVTRLTLFYIFIFIINGSEKDQSLI